MHFTLRDRFMQLAVEEMKGAKQRRPSIEELNKYFIGCDSVWKGYDANTHWCGIFATYLLRKAGAKVRWVMALGIHNLVGRENPEGYMHTTFHKGNTGIGVGDICVRGRGRHHFIVFGPPDEHGNFERCIEGNYGGIENPLLHDGKRWKNNVNNVDCFYRVSNVALLS